LSHDNLNIIIHKWEQSEHIGQLATPHRLGGIGRVVPIAMGADCSVAELCIAGYAKV